VAAAVGRESGHNGTVAAARQLATTDGRPSRANPDLLEYALFNAAWGTSG